MHINVLELKAILSELKSLWYHICDSDIKILSDNTTAVHCISIIGSCRSITKSIWECAIKRRLWLSSAHIPGRLNMKADEESRKIDLRTEWKLNRTIFHNVLEYFQYYPEIDLFALRLNAQFLRFFSYRRDRFAEVTNAFAVPSEDLKFLLFSTLCMHRQRITKNFCR